MQKVESYQHFPFCFIYLYQFDFICLLFKRRVLTRELSTTAAIDSPNTVPAKKTKLLRRHVTISSSSSPFSILPLLPRHTSWHLRRALFLFLSSSSERRTAPPNPVRMEWGRAKAWGVCDGETPPKDPTHVRPSVPTPPTLAAAAASALLAFICLAEERGGRRRNPSSAFPPPPPLCVLKWDPQSVGGRRSKSADGRLEWKFFRTSKLHFPDFVLCRTCSPAVSHRKKKSGKHKNYLLKNNMRNGLQFPNIQQFRGQTAFPVFCLYLLPSGIWQSRLLFNVFRPSFARRGRHGKVAWELFPLLLFSTTKHTHRP